VAKTRIDGARKNKRPVTIKNCTFTANGLDRELEAMILLAETLKLQAQAVKTLCDRYDVCKSAPMLNIE
jgi:hypothetical protein